MPQTFRRRVGAVALSVMLLLGGAMAWGTAAGQPEPSEPQPLSLDDLAALDALLAEDAEEAVAVVANTRKLRAKWSPELAQDLNAYHSLDAEVELTQILSEQIALEIDREILNDLLMQGNAANYYWSRAPGKFVNKETGAEYGSRVV